MDTQRAGTEIQERNDRATLLGRMNSKATQFFQRMNLVSDICDRQPLVRTHDNNFQALKAAMAMRKAIEDQELMNVTPEVFDRDCGPILRELSEIQRALETDREGNSQALQDIAALRGQLEELRSVLSRTETPQIVAQATEDITRVAADINDRIDHLEHKSSDGAPVLE